MLRQIRIITILVLVLTSTSALAQNRDGLPIRSKPILVTIPEFQPIGPLNDTGSPANVYGFGTVATSLKTYNSTSNLEAKPNRLIVEYDPTLAHDIFEDFLNGSSFTPLEKINQLAAAGGGTGQVWLPSLVFEDAWGVIEAQHGTGTFSRLDLVGKTNSMHGVAVGVGTAYEYQTRFSFANLSNETNRYIAFDGFFDSDTVDPTFNRGILFRYSDDINQGRFQVVVREAPGVETLIDTGVTAETGVWYRLNVRVNASGDEAIFSINGNEVAVVTTNLAIGPSNRYTAESNTDRLTGNTPFVSRRFDYVRFRALSGRSSRL